MSPVSSKDPITTPPPPLPRLALPPTYRFDDAITLKYKCLSLSTTPCSQEQSVSLETNEDRPKSSKPNPRLTTPPPPAAQSSVPLTYYQINDAVTLKYKCLVFDSCTIHDFFIEAFLSLAPLKLKKISFNEVSYLHDCTLLYRLAADPLIEMESLELLLSELPDQKKEFLEPLSLKKLLRSVKFSCLRKNAQCFDDVTFKHFDKKLVSDTPNEKTF